MIELFQMWAFVEVLGLLSLPLTMTVFHNLPDRGWAFSKAIGIAVLAFCVWLPLMVFQVLPFSQIFIGGVLLIVLAFNIIGFLRIRETIMKVVRINLAYILITEAIFLGMVFLLGWIRSYGPDIRSFEMFMDEGFLAAIMRSPHFPPNDMWLSSYPINYYYYSHYTIAMMAKLLGQSPSIAFNTGICTFFGLTAVNLFGVTTNIVAWARYRRKDGQPMDAATRIAPTNPTNPTSVYPPLLRATPYGCLTILMGLVMGNLAATQEWWHFHGDLPPLYWFDPSRVVDKTINEFPAFSFLLSCFHAHVLALAFTILAIALAFNLFLEGDGKGLFAFGYGWQLLLTLCTTALILGGLFTMNGWDFPTYLGLALACIGIQQWLACKGHFHWEFLLDLFTPWATLTALSFLFYLPFYLHFISPSQGIGIVGSGDRSAFNSEILIYGTFGFIFLSLLIASALNHAFLPPAAPVSTTKDKGTEQGFSNGSEVEFKVAASSLMGSGAFPDSPLFPLQIEKKNSREVLRTEAIDSVVVGEEKEEKKLVGPPQWLNGWTLGILALIGADLILSAILHNSAVFLVSSNIAVLGAALMFYRLRERSQAFILLLGSLAFLLIAACEIVFLRDVFADNYPRMNTVFKFYFQCWALLSITSSAGLFFILESFRPAEAVSKLQSRMQRGVEALWLLGLSVLLLAGLVYPVVGSNQRTNHYTQRSNSLDGLDYLQFTGPQGKADYAAIRWLNSHVSGDPVIVEAVGLDYSGYGRVSAFTGLPTIMGWVGHEYQWRVNWLNNDANAADFANRSRQ
ncbi:MAG: DUF2298 domain-containing protein, partial [Chloroflexota bacterium]|nr:DUF2298 domain-containing protein [Chloroflexota bacterium]